MNYIGEAFLISFLWIFHTSLSLYLYITMYSAALCAIVKRFVGSKSTVERLEDLCQQLTKIPQHISFLLLENSISEKSLAELVVWSLVVGIQNISLYDEKGKLKHNQDKLLLQIHQQVKKLKLDRQIRVTWQPNTSLTGCHDKTLVISKDGTVYVDVNGNGKVIVCDSDGAVVKKPETNPFEQENSPHEDVNGKNGINGKNGVNGHQVNGTNGRNLSGKNGHSLNGQNGHCLNGQNGHITKGVNGHIPNGLNGHKNGSTNGVVQKNGGFGNNGCASYFSNGDSCHKTDNVLTMKLALLSAEDGKHTIARCARELSDKVHAGTLHPDHIDEGLVDEALHKGFPDPSLVVRLGSLYSNANYPPWQLRLSEIHSMNTAAGVHLQMFSDVLRRYSRCEQRFGK